MIRSCNGNESRAGLAIMPEGSETGYRRFQSGGVLAAAIHFHDLDDPDGDANVAIVSREPTLYDAVLIGFATREQGLLVAHGNPLQIHRFDDVISTTTRMVMRPEGAGAQQLLTALLKRQGLSPDDLRKPLVAPTGPDVAQAIRSDHADAGIATRAVAAAAGLDFIPLCTERFDLVLRQRDYFRSPLQTLFKFLSSDAFAARARELGGLDVAAAGHVRWAP